MNSRQFETLVRDAIDSLPARFRERMKNVAVLVRAQPQRVRKANAPPRRRDAPLVLGEYIGVPQTERSVFSVPSGPDKIVLYQKNIEAVCGSAAEIREQVRLTLIHELGHYFGMTEEQLRDV
jgi:predicted Zn-dependent protease with MMP-like domain